MKTTEHGKVERGGLVTSEKLSVLKHRPADPTSNSIPQVRTKDMRFQRLMLVFLAIASIMMMASSILAVPAREVEIPAGEHVYPADRDGDCQTVYYYDDTLSYGYAWPLPQDSVEWFAERFTNGPEACTLKTVRVRLYRPFMTGTPDLAVAIWDDDGFGLPGNLQATVTVTAELLPPEDFGWAEADFSACNLIFGGGTEFHIGMSTVGGEGDTLWPLTDTGAGPHAGENRSEVDYGGTWYTLHAAFGVDFVFMIEADMCCVEPAAGGITVSLSGPGVWPGDTIQCGLPVTFNVRMNNTTGDPIHGSTNGFRLYSPDGAEWEIPTYDAVGGLDAYYDGGVHVVGLGVDGVSDDTIAIGGMQISAGGIPNGYDGVILTITTEINSDDSGKTICLDSTYFPPAGPWIWALPDTTIVPEWGGPYCYQTKFGFIYHGYKYNDLDGSGTKDPGESGIPNWTIYLYEFNNPPPSGQPYDQAVTDNNGEFGFWNYKLPPTWSTLGFWLVEKQENGWQQTEPDPSTNNGMRYMPPGCDWNDDYNFGNMELDSVTISGTKFHDENGNSKRELGEGGLQYVEMRLTGTDAFGPVSRVAYTNAQGDYTFDALMPGSYKVQENVSSIPPSHVPPTGPTWVQTFPTTVFYTYDNLTWGDDIIGCDFGNDTCDWDNQPNHTFVTCRHGTDDNFGGPEPSYVSPGLLAFLTTQYDYITDFDQPASDECFGHTFEGCFDHQKCLVDSATLRIKLHASGSQPNTDWLALGDYSQGNNGRIWSISLNDLEQQYGGGTPPWSYCEVMDVTLDLTKLWTAPGSWLPTNILGALQDGDLDVVVSDDTEVDFIELYVEICCKPCDDLEQMINTGYDNDQAIVLNSGDNDDDWELIGTEDFSYNYTYLPHEPSVVTSDAPQGLARWIGLPGTHPTDRYYWFQYEFCLDDDYSDATLVINSGESNDSLWFYLNGNLIAGPYGPNEPIVFSHFAPAQNPPFVVGTNRITLKLGTDPDPEPKFILDGVVQALRGECCDSAACCDCDYTPECYYTDEQTCLRDKGTFHRYETCNTIDCDDACYAYGDINNDGFYLTVSDLTYLIRLLMGLVPAPDYLYQADLNGDCLIGQPDLDMFNCYMTTGPSCFTNGFPVKTCCCPTMLKCCIAQRGNVDGDPDNQVNVADLTYLVAYLFQGGPEPPCMGEANVDGDPDEQVNVADLTYLVAYLFQGGSPPLDCDETQKMGAVGKVGGEISLCTAYGDGKTTISLVSEVDVRGIQMTLSGESTGEAVKLADDNLELLSHCSDGTVRLGLLDLEGAAVIRKGTRALVSLPGRYEITNALVSDLNHTAVVPSINPAHREANLPQEYVLHQNYPNPFNPTTEIRFSLPSAGDVTLQVYNLLGQQVRSLAGGFYEAGSHTLSWDGTNQAGQSVSSGVYFYRLQAGSFEETKKMMLLK